MKRIASMMVIAAVIGIALSTGVAFAKDVVVSGVISSAVSKLDKNGNEYVRLIIPEKRTMAGIEYEAGVPVMCFSDTVDIAKTLKAGDQIKAICAENEYQGRTSYTLRVLVK